MKGYKVYKDFKSTYLIQVWYNEKEMNFLTTTADRNRLDGNDVVGVVAHGLASVDGGLRSYAHHLLHLYLKYR